MEDARANQNVSKTPLNAEIETKKQKEGDDSTPLTITRLSMSLLPAFQVVQTIGS
jgi:hypothetical protein